MAPSCDMSVTDISFSARMGSNGPLSPAVFHILLALGGGQKHGYEIMKLVRLDSSGAIRMGTGTLYGSIKRMLAAGLIEEIDDRPAGAGFDDERRRYYRTTDAGARALAAELRRYSDSVAVARNRRLKPVHSRPPGR